MYRILLCRNAVQNPCTQDSQLFEYKLYACVYVWVPSHVQLDAAPWTGDLQAPLFMEFSRQEYWSGLPFPTPRALPDPGIKPTFLYLLYWQADSLLLRHLGRPSSILISVTSEFYKSPFISLRISNFTNPTSFFLLVYISFHCIPLRNFLRRNTGGQIFSNTWP